MGYISSETLISYCALLVQAFNKNGSIYLKFRCPRVISVFFLTYFQQDATLHTLFISGKILYIFRLVSPPIIRSTHNCIYSIWYLPNFLTENKFQTLKKIPQLINTKTIIENTTTMQSHHQQETVSC